ncbi:ATP-binding protein, partial [Nocardia pseudovaccinii]|uniref:ATP-binding protein n=1 Tax=Nocardia pseudovaccinii TaxID=189540 RepID=UPI001470E9BC
VSAVVSAAMARDPLERPSAAALGEAIRQAQRRQGFSVDEMAIHVAETAREHQDHKPATRGWRPPVAAKSRGVGGLPVDLTSFVDRRTELVEVRNLLSSVPVVTLTGIGGVGKTRLALRAAATARRDFPEGVWLVELAHVSDPSLLVNVVAAALGLRDPARPLPEVVVEFLSTRQMLLVLDNCEQLVAAVAELVESWVRACPHLRILATSREPLNIAGEAVLQVSPLTVPDPDRTPSLHGLPRYDAVTLFTDRARALVSGFELSEENKSAVVGICARLDGLPLAIELAAARVRAMSPEQILQRLNDRYALLTRGSRTAPTRQQTLRWCVDWSYQLCTPAERRLWARLSVFAGGFELDAAEQICGTDLAPEDPLDVLSSLVDKSILVRDESDGVVRFRMLETVRDYGRQKLREFGEDQRVRRRHRDWYQQLALAAEAGWISDRQPYWTARLEREQPNLRDALECCLAEDTDEAAEAGLRTASALSLFWNFRGLHGEGRRWIDRVLAHPHAQSIPDRVNTLHSGTVLAATQGDLESAAALVEQAHALAEQAPAPMTQALATYAEGVLALYSGDLARASSLLERAIAVFSSNRQGYLYVVVSAMLGQLHALRGDTERAIEYHERVLSITEACGESLFRSISLLGKGFAVWQQGRPERAQELLEQALRVNRRIRSPFAAAVSIEFLAWTVGSDGDAERAAVLMGAAAELSRFVGSVASFVPGSSHYHDQCDRSARAALGAHRFGVAVRHGRAMGMDEAVAYALREQPIDTARAPDLGAALTKRERQVAALIAQGLTNKQIAAKLVISPRTADGHVEHILTKLGFTSRAQIAAWVAADAERQSH